MGTDELKVYTRFSQAFKMESFLTILNNLKPLTIVENHSSQIFLDTPMDLLCKSMGWFLFDRDLRHERVQEKLLFAAEQKMGLHLIKKKESFGFTQGNIYILDSYFSKRLFSIK